jgi:hypothetical protein
MLCEVCASVGRMRVSEAQQQSAAKGEGLSLACDACGKTLGATVGDRVVGKLKALARFGLVGQTLLARRRG